MNFDDSEAYLISTESLHQLCNETHQFTKYCVIESKVVSFSFFFSYLLLLLLLF